MSERAIPVTTLIRLGSGELAQEKPASAAPWPILAVAGIILVGVAFWAAAGD